MNQIPNALVDHLVLVLPPLVVAGIVAVVVVPLVRRNKRLRQVCQAIAGVGMVVPVVALWVVLPLLTGLPLRSMVHVWIALAWLVLPIFTTALFATPDHAAADRAAKALGRGQWWRLTRIRVPLVMPGVVAGIRRSWIVVVPSACVAGLFTDHGLGGLMVAGYRNSDVMLVVVGLAVSVAVAWLGGVVLGLVEWPLMARRKVAT